MALADQEAKRFSHEYVETEHILLGVVMSGVGAGPEVLRRHGLDLPKVRFELAKLVQPGPEMVTFGKLPKSPRAKEVLRYASEEAKELRHDYVGTGHLLLGLLRERDGIAAQVLRGLGLQIGAARDEVRGLAGASDEEDLAVSAGRLSEDLLIYMGLGIELPRPGCELCARIDRISQGQDPALIAELDQTYAILGDNQGLRGWCVLLLKGHREHLGELDVPRQCRVFADVARVAAAVREMVRPRRVNYECLGNVAPHIHWHVIPRHEDDPEPRAPVWGWSAERLRGDMGEAERAELVEELRRVLR
jgi:diadenosine tetraphosphate (Ap4A) HIT family hydrolase